MFETVFYEWHRRWLNKMQRRVSDSTFNIVFPFVLFFALQRWIYDDWKIFHAIFVCHLLIFSLSYDCTKNFSSFCRRVEKLQKLRHSCVVQAKKKLKNSYENSHMSLDAKRRSEVIPTLTKSHDVKLSVSRMSQTFQRFHTVDCRARHTARFP